MQGVGNLICYDYLSVTLSRTACFCLLQAPVEHTSEARRRDDTRVCVRSSRQCSRRGRRGRRGRQCEPQVRMAYHTELYLLSFVFPCSRRCYKFLRLQPKKAGRSSERQDPNAHATTFETSKATEHLRSLHKKVSKRMLGVKAEQINATAEAVVPAKRAKTLGKKLRDNLESTEPKSAHKLQQAENKSRFWDEKVDWNRPRKKKSPEPPPFDFFCHKKSI